jgi:D-glycero-alpha-D-manno-heptose 1-phosphate guanylyltransferase
VAVRQVADVSRYGALNVTNGRIHQFLEKGPSGPGLINAGTYILSRAIIDLIPDGEVYSFEQQLLMPRVTELAPAAFLADGLFIDIGVPDDYARAQCLFGPNACDS